MGLEHPMNYEFKWVANPELVFEIVSKDYNNFCYSNIWASENWARIQII
jgi:hypothetical protein